ncbi:uncharacterized protein LOC117176743 [Belonocnema kinseyi]|uniref:uncharacterized protein LOC117176743 n=1 Tax=Belonocnema kinseyi TaxID=2817044 RepID=UPI00143D510D|nr:uncharacterized protein LOC117176743 [Belonocnema kinseyi]
MWTKLSNIHEQKTASNKFLLMQNFHEYRMDQNASISQHVAKVENMARQLKDLGEAVSNVAVMAKILGSLPSKYSSLLTAWHSVASDQQTLDNLYQRLLKEECRLGSNDDVTNALATMTMKQKAPTKSDDTKNQHQRKDIECNYCHKKGHIIKNFRKRISANNRKNNDSGDASALLAVDCKGNSWISE